MRDEAAVAAEADASPARLAVASLRAALGDAVAALRSRAPLRHCVSLLALAAVTWVSRGAWIERPIGAGPSSAAIARAALAVSAFEARGLVASGGLTVPAPLPVPAEEGIRALEPPLFAWTALAVRRFTGASPIRAAALADALCLFLAVAGIYALATRRAGAVGGFVAGSFLAVTPLVVDAGAGEPRAGLAAGVLLAAALEWFLRRRSAALLAAVVAVSLLGSLAHATFLVDAAMAVAAAALVLRRDALRPGTLLALASPFVLGALVLAVMERLAGTASLLAETGLWRTGGIGFSPIETVTPPGGPWVALDRIVHGVSPLVLVVGAAGYAGLVVRRFRTCAIPVALAASAFATFVLLAPRPEALPASLVRLVPPLALGCAVIAGWMRTRWSVGASLLAAALAVTLLGSASGTAAPEADRLEELGRAVRERVPFGEAFAWSGIELDAATAVCERPVLPLYRHDPQVARLVVDGGAAVRPVRWLFVSDVEDDPPLADFLGRLRSALPFEREGSVHAFRLSADAGPSGAEVSRGLLGSTWVPGRGFHLELPARDGVAQWRVEAGPWSMMSTQSAPIPAGGDSLAVPADYVPLERFWMRAVPIDATGAEGASTAEIFVRSRGLRKLRSRALALAPLLGLFLVLLVPLLHAGFPPRRSSGGAEDDSG